MRFKEILKRVLLISVAVGCLVWVFYDIRLPQLLSDLQKISWQLVVLAVIIHFISYILQGLRWSFLLRPLGRISTMNATWAVYIGLLVNEILPLRAGELARAFLASRWLKKDFVAVLPSIILGRFIDGVWMLSAIIIAAAVIPLPQVLIRDERIFAFIILILSGVFFYIILRKGKFTGKNKLSRRLNWKPFQYIVDLISQISQGLRTTGRSRYFVLSLVASLFFLLLQFLALYIIVLAYGISLSLWEGGIVFIILVIGTAIPNTPSNVGTYQFFLVLGLTLFGISKTTASGFSMIAYIFLTLPVWLLGMVALSRTGLKLSALRSEISKLRNHHS